DAWSLPSMADEKSFQSTPAWKAATKLKPPIAAVTAQGEAEGSEWWLEHEALLGKAWLEWEETTKGLLPPLNASLIHPDLREKVYRCWTNPTKENEDEVHDLWKEVVFPHQVFSFEHLLTNEGIRAVRSHLDAISDSGIPTRRPNAMNRFGVLFDPAVPGGVSHTPLLSFLDVLVNGFVRPLGRLFFPAFVQRDDDASFYAFTIRYSADEDLKLDEHSDASVVSLNLNLNHPEEKYTGSSIYFVVDEKDVTRQSKDTAQSSRNPRPKQRHELQFEPGTALIHRGMLRHGAIPISEGHRHNLVIWLYGKDGSVRFAPYEPHEQLSRAQRWSDETTQCQNDRSMSKHDLDFEIL
ncbi:MAG: hypothetical protein SGILL_009538, partial [Bacillariaceae sp.]